ncbi:MAG: hypothetical protein FWD57_15815 [Polyangiaceae bacterium]|nr:hypothetical protein [Polyangiaceae bacterium]
MSNVHMLYRRGLGQWTIAAVGLALLTMCGCGGGQAEPQLAPDRTAPGVERGTTVATCKWSPPLPEGREDPCNPDNDGAVLNITERLDMRAESRYEDSYTCRCQ